MSMYCPLDGKECWYSSGCFFQNGYFKICSKQKLTIATDNTLNINEMKADEKNNITNPDFNEWIKSKNGRECMAWPIMNPEYLYNRLFWAFDAGYNHAKSELKEEIKQLKRVAGVIDNPDFK